MLAWQVRDSRLTLFTKIFFLKLLKCFILSISFFWRIFHYLNYFISFLGRFLSKFAKLFHLFFGLVSSASFLLEYLPVLAK